MNFPKFILSVFCLAGWFSKNQNRVIDFLMEENRTLQELLGQKLLKLNDQQRRRLAAKDKPISRKVLQEICSLVPLDTLRRWLRKFRRTPNKSANTRRSKASPTKRR